MDESKYIELIIKPYPNEHAARLENPDKYDEFRRTKGGTIYGSIEVPKTISIIWGHVNGEPRNAWHPQALRFPIENWTVSQAKKWLKDNKIDYISFEPAEESKQIIYNDKKFETKEELHEFLIKNKDTLIAQKKSQKKEVDCSVIINPVIIKEKQNTNKSNPLNIEELDKIKVKVIINTTNLMDSHSDVHVPGLWKKSISENKFILHVQEHASNEFKKIIADGEDLKVYTKKYSWSELGYDFEGETEALIFESIIRKDRNEFMYKQYANGWVKNHSVGMMYVKTDIAINDEKYPNEFGAWKKYISIVANKELALERGFFWYVLEAKVIEGSAVPLGSNYITPTLLIENIKYEPSKDTHYKIEPDASTHKIDYNYLIHNLKLK